MEQDKKYDVSFEIKEITASSYAEFTEKVKAITNEDTEISNIVAIVVTKTISDP